MCVRLRLGEKKEEADIVVCIDGNQHIEGERVKQKE